MHATYIQVPGGVSAPVHAACKLFTQELGLRARASSARQTSTADLI